MAACFAGRLDQKGSDLRSQLFIILGADFPDITWTVDSF
jgi:hypothetical protein